jgi:arabinose-5-phosphate isomerase
MYSDVIKRAREILALEGNAILDMGESLDSSFAEAIDLLVNAKGRIVISGMGKSGIVGKKISSTLSSVGTPSFFLHPAEAIHGDLGMITRNDVVIAISNSGESEEIVRLLPILHRFGLKLIALCGRENSTLAKRADVFIDVGVKEEACPWDIVPTASTTAVLAMGDALAIVLMEKKGFLQKEFVEFHPGGSLGKGMLVKVDDIMHTGKDMPVVYTDVSLKTVIGEISAKKFGMTIVVDTDGKLKGIITDGDLRRLFQRAANPIGKVAREIMTPNPKTIKMDAMGGAAVKLMEEDKITCLVCVDDSGEPQGIIHLHDLLRAGVV